MSQGGRSRDPILLGTVVNDSTCFIRFLLLGNTCSVPMLSGLDDARCLLYVSRLR